MIELGIQCYFAAVELILFLGMAFIRALLLRKEGIKAIHFGNIDELFKPKKLYSIGRVSETILRDLFPERSADTKYIRHPSHGGKADFLKGMAEFSLGERPTRPKIGY